MKKLRQTRFIVLFALVFSSRGFAAGKSDIIAPAVSLLLPGFDQWWEGQYQAAGVYSGLWLSGKLVEAEALVAMGTRVVRSRDAGIDSRADDVRRAMLGSQVAFASGSYSMLHAFRNAADSRRPGGQYGFLKEDVSVRETVLAPFDFGYLKRPSTVIPLGVIAALAVYQTNANIPGYESASLTGADVFYSGSFSYLAGTHEEALFRGWMMPVLREYVAGDMTSNILQSLIFALAHKGTVDVPIPQLLLGYHLGYVTQRNGWALGEAAFIHTWWDVIAFLASYSVREAGSSRGVVREPVLRLPPVSIVF